MILESWYIFNKYEPTVVDYNDPKNESRKKGPKFLLI